MAQGVVVRDDVLVTKMHSSQVSKEIDHEKNRKMNVLWIFCSFVFVRASDIYERYPIQLVGGDRDGKLRN